MSMAGVRWAKGHGTENDFVLVLDEDGTLEITPDEVAAICDRRAGIGGDGLIRVTRQTDPERDPAAAPDDPDTAGLWFMDYRNSDGSFAEMCGNGIRVFAAYLLHAGLLSLADGESVRVITRSGVKTVRREGDRFAADLGAWRVDAAEQNLQASPAGQSAGSAGPAGRTVRLPRSPSLTGLTGLSVDVGNPHVVVELARLDQLQGADLSVPPTVEPPSVGGTNVEFAVIDRAPGGDIPPDAGHVVMRVHERGSGETRSCGTGAVAVALAAGYRSGPDGPRRWIVDVPGGRLEVRQPGGSRVHGSSAELIGPAVIVAEGELLG